jgi:hypothetical protein
VHCFTGNEDVAHYQRLAPLCEAIGAFIEQTKDVDNEFLDMAARTLARVPTSVIAGPLRSWVDALAHRFADGKINKEERAYLQMIVRPPFTSVADSDSERQALVAPLAKVLAARKPVMRRRAQAKSVVR